MKKILLSLFFFSQALASLYAHPLDVSNTTMTLYDDYVMGVTYIHPVELDRILISSGGISPASIGVDTYYSLTGVLTQYLSETITLENQGKNCAIGEYSFQEELMIDEIYSGGFPISYVFRCHERLVDPIITINFLIEVPLQTNKLSIYRLFDDELQRTDYRVLNARKNTHSISFALDPKTLRDSDADGIVDEDEYLYRTDPQKSDTDEDGYSDGLEIDKSWDPLSSQLSPGQRAYTKSDTTNSGVAPLAVLANDLSQDSNIWGNVYFGKILREIRKFADKELDRKNIILLLSLIAFLGFLHAMGPGHSKGILISQILDEGMSYTKSITYCALFTLFHLLDVFIVVILSKVFFEYMDSSTYLSVIGRLSSVLVLVAGIYLLITSIKKYLQKISPSYRTKNLQNKSFFLMAIMTGLAPCAFGWTIFLMLIAIGKTYLAIPFLLALGFGIFACLLLIASLAWLFRQRIYRISPHISRFSPIISSFLIVIIGFTLISQNF